VKPVDDPSWESYANTILEFPNSVEIDLREPLTEHLRVQLGELGPSPFFAVISAANPKGASEDDSRNRDAAALLKLEIQHRRFAFVAVRGRSAQGEYQEHGFAVFAPFEDAKVLAVASDQSAFFWYDGANFWLMGALVDSPAIRLPKR